MLIVNIKKKIIVEHFVTTSISITR